MSPSLNARPSTRLSDLWKAPLHDIPIRDEILHTVASGLWKAARRVPTR